MKCLIVLSLLLFALVALGEPYPDTYRYQILTTDKTSSTVTEHSFKKIPESIVLLYRKELERERINLVVKSDWEKPFFTAWTNKESDHLYALNFWGGLARIPGMDEEGHALIACHELGHILGGTPRMKILQFLWASSEGQADYFASNVCLRRVFFKTKTTADVSGAAYTLCRSRFQSEKKFLVCLQTMKGIEAFGHVLAHLSQYQSRPSVATSASEVASETLFNSYPDPQCRLDTLVRGALNLPRPSCWFRPLLGEE